MGKKIVFERVIEVTRMDSYTERIIIENRKDDNVEYFKNLQRVVLGNTQITIPSNYNLMDVNNINERGELI